MTERDDLVAIGTDSYTKGVRDTLTIVYSVIGAMPETAAVGSRDFGRGYAKAIRDVQEVIEGTIKNGGF